MDYKLHTLNIQDTVVLKQKAMDTFNTYHKVIYD